MSNFEDRLRTTLRAERATVMARMQNGVSCSPATAPTTTPMGPPGLPSPLSWAWFPGSVMALLVAMVSIYVLFSDGRTEGSEQQIFSQPGVTATVVATAMPTVLVESLPLPAVDVAPVDNTPKETGEPVAGPASQTVQLVLYTGTVQGPGGNTNVTLRVAQQDRFLVAEIDYEDRPGEGLVLGRVLIFDEGLATDLWKLSEYSEDGQVVATMSLTASSDSSRFEGTWVDLTDGAPSSPSSIQLERDGFEDETFTFDPLVR